MADYRIIPVRNGYELREGGKTFGRLVLQARHRASAEVRVDDSVMKLSRSALFRKHLTGNHSHHGTLRFDAHLAADTITLAGRTYHWSPRNASWTEWEWRETGSRQAIRIHMDYLGNGTVKTVEDLSGKEEKELALLGWYLVLLNHQDFGTHLIAAAKTLFSGKKTAHA